MNNWNIRFWEYEFFAPNWLWLLCLVPVLAIILFVLERKKGGSIKYSRNIDSQKSLGSTWIIRFREVSILSYCLVATLLIIAMAKPFHWSLHDDYQKEFKDGIDIVIAMDVSGSMMAQDFVPNRLEASKKVAKEFIDGRKGDRIGLVAYAGEAFTACPPTLDYQILKNQIDLINGDFIGGGTAIGVGLGTAVARLRSDSLASKVIILLTDGVDGGAEPTPLEAAELAKAKNIRVYTIGVGSTGEASTLVNSPFGSYYSKMEVEIDEVTLQKIAAKTNGQYFRATNEESLKSIYNEIEKLEKRKIEDQEFKSDPPPTPTAFLNWAFVLIIITWVSNKIIFRHDD